MLIVALVLAVIGLAALVTAVVTSNELIAWVCIGASVIGVVLLIVDALRDRSRDAGDGTSDTGEGTDDADGVPGDDAHTAVIATPPVDYPDDDAGRDTEAQTSAIAVHPEPETGSEPDSEPDSEPGFEGESEVTAEAAADEATDTAADGENRAAADPSPDAETTKRD